MTSRNFGACTSVLGLMLIAALAPSAFAQGTRIGDTFYPKPADGTTIRWPGVAYDSVNDAYLVNWTGFVGNNNHRVGARFVKTDGSSPGAAETVNVAPGGAGRAACGAEINACLIVWQQEPTSIVGRLVRYSAGSVSFLTAPFVINNGLAKLTSSGPSVAYSPSAQEFLVAWADIGNVIDVQGQRVAGNGTLAGGVIPIATTALWEGFPSVVFNSTKNEYFVGYYQELAGGTNTVAGRRIQPGTGALLGASNTFYVSAFAQYPELAYNSRTDQYLAVTWGFAGGWMLKGQLADSNANPVGTALALAAGGGGDGIGVTYNPVTNTYFSVYQSQTNGEVWGVTIGPAGVPTTQFQVTVTGTQLAVQPRPAASTKTTQFLAGASNRYGSIMGQLVKDGSGPVAGIPFPEMALETPAAGTNVVSGFAITGWAVDRGAPAGTGVGVDTLHVYAAPANGSPAFYVGDASPTIPRPDVAQQYGDQFSVSGFTFNARLAPGTYDILVFARSTVSNSFNNAKRVRVVVAAGARTTPTADLDGDGRTDITVYQPASGYFSTLISGQNFGAAAYIGWGGPAFTPVPGDYDGDGKSDRTVYRESTGDWYTLASSTGFTPRVAPRMGGQGWKPVPGDYDGDGKTDYAVYSPAFRWYALLSSTNYTTSFTLDWGAAGYTPVPADYDGDGKTDAALYHVASGTWFIRASSTGLVLTRNAGGPAFTPFPADFDGDGKADIAVYQQATGLWYARKSSTNDTTTVSIYWGGPAYTPVKGDFDGDGKTDLALYRATDGFWAILLSAQSYTRSIGLYWGGVGYIPLGIVP